MLGLNFRRGGGGDETEELLPQCLCLTVGSYSTNRNLCLVIITATHSVEVMQRECVKPLYVGDQNNDMSTHERKGLKMRWIVSLHEEQFSDVEQEEFGAVIQKRTTCPLCEAR